MQKFIVKQSPDATSNFKKKFVGNFCIMDFGACKQ
jgi:hypothetical protein